MFYPFPPRNSYVTEALLALLTYCVIEKQGCKAKAKLEQTAKKACSKLKEAKNFALTKSKDSLDAVYQAGFENGKNK